jgi:hydroxylaminobenzene mutase
MNNNAIRHGLVLIALALIFGIFIPSMEVPRLGLSAHTIGVLSGVLLIALGAVWQQFSLSARQLLVMYWAWLYSSYANWLGSLVGAIFGAGNTTPVASGDYVGTPIIENIVTTILMSVAISSLVAVALSIWGLRVKEN